MKRNLNLAFLAFGAVLCVVSVADSATHVIDKRTIFSEPVNEIPGPQKNYTGIRADKGSKLAVYYCEQTIGILELRDDNRVINCELLEVRTKTDRSAALISLREVTDEENEITFQDMVYLMQLCQLIDPPSFLKDQLNKYKIKEEVVHEGRSWPSIFSGVFPKTKWCGPGDLADNYHEIGPNVQLDKCCRTHDFCPVKVLGFRTQLGLTNYGPYTRSHCECESEFNKCLKGLGTNTADFIGNLYFNVAKFICVDDVVAQDGTIRREFRNKQHPY